VSDTLLYRLAAVALVVGAVLSAGGNLLAPQGGARAAVASGLYYPMGIAVLLGGLLVMGGWTAVYLRPAPTGRRPGPARRSPARCRNRHPGGLRLQRTGPADEFDADRQRHPLPGAEHVRRRRKRAYAAVPGRRDDHQLRVPQRLAIGCEHDIGERHHDHGSGQDDGLRTSNFATSLRPTSN
jgi:hypothetical protein